MTKKEFLHICKKYNLVTRQEKAWEGSSIYISAYIPGMVYEPEDTDKDSLADFESESWDDDLSLIHI